MMSARREQVRKRRQVLQRVIDVTKSIGKCALGYRGSKNEAAHSLADMSVDHGNFLEILLLLSKYDSCLQQHVQDCIQKSQSSTGKGRGSRVTLMSKTTVCSVLEAIRQLIKETIATEVNQAGMYTVQIDTTQDITSKDQCSVVVRYVTESSIQEKLLAVVECKSSTGEDFLKLLKETLATCKLDVKNCIGNSTDGAANMQGQYRGFSAWLSKEVPTQMHVWCYAHVLNLVMSETTGVVITAASLFGLINEIAVFLRDSYQRMNVWEGVSQDPQHRRISLIGETRWSSKDAALKKIFGSFAQPKNALYVDLVETLSKIQNNLQFKPAVRVKAHAFIESLIKYETVLTAQLFLRVFTLTSPLSKYLQTNAMDLLTAHRMVTETHNKLQDFVRDFDTVKDAADNLVKWANGGFQNVDSEMEVQAALPPKRMKKRKTMPGKSAYEENTTADSLTAYRINVHNIILIQSLSVCTAASCSTGI
ncbi:protein FAM200A-like [Acanthochromis polyacanthus]|uniref:protein FAM200A-like n=1 Tax=Acanthochromis polyacanthus TaxID=80966 RepID=UPI002233FFE7|nr:protein FAM200A-like [Acanthochromis polyacanthus]XP_051796630.1 protein FAM200A-like [Acanthochromis polyacanthus]XP_051796631.1 protein FAM200A-like [Acanthochromis polyacanthus]